MNREKSHPTIAYLTRSIHTTTSMSIWLGAADEARKHNANFICVVGEQLGASAGSMLYDLITERTVDAVMSWASSDYDDTIQFYDRYRSIPVVTLTLPVENRPVVLVDSYQGIRAIMTHLIEDHGYRHIAFIRGPEQHVYSQERYRGYLDALNAYELPQEPNLVVPPLGWGFASGVQAVRVLCEQRHLQISADIHAIVATNDRLAIGALQALQYKGFRVPEDVAVIGFNDSVEARCTTPTLTSVAMPFSAQGQQAVELLMAMLDGQSVPERIALPATMVIHQSCGCLEPVVAQAETLSSTPIERIRFETAFAQQRPALLRALAENFPEFDRHWVETVVDAFVTDLTDADAGQFLSVFTAFLEEARHTDSDILPWQNFISLLRHYTLPCLDSSARIVRAENLWGQTRIIIGETAYRKEIALQWYTILQAETLREINQLLMTTFHVKGVIETLIRGLRSVKIPGCYLALYENPCPYAYPQPAPEWSRLILAYHESRQIELEPGGLRFPSHDLLPKGLFPPTEPYSLVVEPLYFRAEQIGFIVFEVGPRDGVIYETLRLDLSSALKGALLMQQVQEHSAQLAREQYILDTFMKNVPDRIYFKDREGRITRANAAHAAWLGLTDAQDEIGKTDFDFFPEHEARLRFEQEQEIMRTGTARVNQEEQRILPGGWEAKWSLVTKMPLRNEWGDIIGTFGISRDITDVKLAQNALKDAYADVERQVAERTRELQQEIAQRRRVEEELRLLNEELERRVDERTRELQRANQALHESLTTLTLAQKQLVQSEKMAALGELVAGVAHEINTPIGVGVMAASHLEQHTHGLAQHFFEKKLTHSELERYVQVASEASEIILRNLQRASEHIKSFKHIAVDQTHEEKRRFLLKSYLDDVLTSLYPKIKNSGHRVTVTCPPDLELYSYPGAFSQIISNFVMNSLTHGFEQISNGEIQITAQEEGGCLTLWYQDNGQGMDRDTQNRVFDPFFTTKRGQGGTGLGMHIVYNLVTQKLLGQITCESSPHNGVRFLIRLPLTAE